MVWVGHNLRALFFGLIGLALFSSNAFALTALDPDFFDGEASFTQPGVQVLDPDFFRSGQGTLSKAEPNTFGCTSVAASSPKAESAVLGRVIQNFCAGQVMTKWIPRDPPFGQTQSWDKTSGNGYFQICCLKKMRGANYRRPGPR